jgi:SAM-dependent methyltransferase
MRDVWEAAESYESYIGRWSREVARQFVSQLSIPPRSSWLEVGCGSGALTEAVLASQDPALVFGIDRSLGFVRHTQREQAASAAAFAVADAIRLPFAEGSADAAVSGLVLNFVSKPELAVREMLRCVRPGGTVAVYVWDYAEGMEIIRFFWDAAIALNPAASQLDEANRFPLCQPAALEELFQRAGAEEVRSSAITVPTIFRDFKQLWSSFLGGQGPAPTYAASLSESERQQLKERLRQILLSSGDHSIALSAKAWVCRGVRVG